MSCARCGKCCSYMTIVPMWSHKGNEDWLGYHGCEIVEHEGVEYIKIPIPCKHLKDGLCEIYETRPKMCKDFPAGKHWECK